MALDINEQVSNAYNAAKQALNDDLKQNLYNATQARVQAFRQINNNANANHALYSGAPSGMQMQYDQSTYLPNIGTMATQALAKQESNQEKWDEYMEYIKELQEQADYYNNKANELNNTRPAGTTTSGGFTNKPSGVSAVQDNTAMADFSGDASTTLPNTEGSSIYHGVYA